MAPLSPPAAFALETFEKIRLLGAETFWGLTSWTLTEDEAFELRELLALCEALRPRQKAAL